MPAIAAVAAVGLLGPGLGSAQAAVPAFSFTELGNLNPGAVSSDPVDFVDAGSDVYFFANTGTTDDLFVSNGGAAAQLVTAANNAAIPEYGSGYLTNVSGTAYFLSNADGNGEAIWVADGSTATKTVIPVNQPAYLQNVGGKLYFEALPANGVGDLQLWSSDGTDATSVLAFPQDTYLSSEVVNVGSTAYFTTRDDGSRGAESLYETNGGPAMQVANSPQLGDYSNVDLTNASGTLYFTADSGDELWEDGGAGGLEQVPGVNASDIGNLTAVGSELFFSPDGEGLAATNGAAGGTVNLLPGDADVYYLTNVGGELFFASEGTDTLWKSDGTLSGTATIEPFGDSYLSYLTNDNGTLAFEVDGTNSATLWTSDGTSANTAASANAPAIENKYEYGSPLTNDGSNLYFAANGGTDGFEPWVAVAPTPPPLAPPTTTTSTTPTPTTPAPTPAPPAPVPTPTVPTPAPTPTPTPVTAVPKVTIVAATSKANALTLKLKCPAGKAVCTVKEQVVVTETFKGTKLAGVSALRFGRSSLEMSRPRGPQLKTTKKTVVLATKTVKINPGKTVSVVVKLDKAGTTLLSSRKKLSVAVRLTVNGKLQTIRKVTLTAPVVKQKTTKK